MQRFFNSLLGLSLLVLVVFSTGCGGDDDGGGGGGNNPLPPAIFLASGDDVISFDSEIPATQESFFVSVDVSDGDALLNSLTITENGTTIPAANLEFDEGLTTAQNPFLIVGDAASGTVYDIEITPTSRQANTTSTFVFTVADVDGLTATTELNITYSAEAATVAVAGDGLVSGDDFSTLNNAFTLNVTAGAGTFDLSQIAVYQNGTLLPAENLSFLVMDPFSVTEFDTNPQAISDPLAFSSFIIVEPDNPADGLTTYTVELIDTEGGAGSATFDLNFFTPQVDVITGIVWNADGPNFGGLDLDSDDPNTNNVPRNSPDAEVRDMGIDLSQPNATNWRRQVEPVNGSDLRTFDPSSIEGFDFETVAGIDEVIAAYNAGVSVNETPVLATGDILAVRNGDNYYLIRIDAVNLTPNNNLDNYNVRVINAAN